MVTLSLLPVGLMQTWTGHSFNPEGPEVQTGQIAQAQETLAAS
jgi:hypothetical protein